MLSNIEDWILSIRHLKYHLFQTIDFIFIVDMLIPLSFIADKIIRIDLSISNCEYERGDR